MVLIPFGELSLLTGCEAALRFWHTIDSDTLVRVNVDGTMEVDLPGGGAAFIETEPDPSSYLASVAWNLDNYQGSDVWGDVVDGLLTEPEQTVPENKERGSAFVHAGVRFSPDEEGWWWKESWTGVIARDGVTQAVYHGWGFESDNVAGRLIEWCASAGVRPALDDSFDDYLEAAEAAGLSIYFGPTDWSPVPRLSTERS